MKRILALLTLAAMAGCGTHQAASDRIMPEVKVAELVGTVDTQMTGPFDVRYGLEVTNPSPQTITLKRVEVRQIGTGAYQLRYNPPVTVNQAIEPGGTIQVAFWLHAYATVLPGNRGSNEPVSLRVVTFYDSPTGGFQKISQTLLGQF